MKKNFISFNKEDEKIANRYAITTHCNIPKPFRRNGSSVGRCAYGHSRSVGTLCAYEAFLRNADHLFIFATDEPFLRNGILSAMTQRYK